jgi:uncharacterized protein YhbP (UPF0306 family)
LLILIIAYEQVNAVLAQYEAEYMDPKISAFIQEQKNMSICTSVHDEPWCACCFYVFLPEEKILVFKSSDKTRHILNALENNKVAGTILADIKGIGEIRGVQFTGLFSSAEDNLLKQARKTYYAKNPVALIMKGDLWAVKLSTVKFTDNSAGFANKLTWARGD